MQKTQGLIAAPPTGFLADGSIDLAVVPPLAEHLHRQGLAGVFVNGTTGEGLSLTTAERETLALAWRKALPAPMRLIVHVGHTCLAESRGLAAHAQRIGADAVATIPPIFYKPAGIDELIASCAAIAEAAPELPFYYYHIPSMTGVSIAVAPFLEAAVERIPNLAGAKFTFESLYDYIGCIRACDGRFDVLWGRDEMLLGALATGAQGAVGSTYNVMAPIFIKLIDAFRNGDLDRARALQARATTTILDLGSRGCMFASLKVLLREQGVPIDTRMRLPIVAPEASLRGLPSMPVG